MDTKLRQLVKGDHITIEFRDQNHFVEPAFTQMKTGQVYQLSARTSLSSNLRLHECFPQIEAHGDLGHDQD